jgi:hypothetical protein
MRTAWLSGGVPDVAQPLRTQIKETNALTARSLLYAVMASVVGTVLTPAFGAGRFGALAGAALGPVIAAVFSTHGRGVARSAGIVVLTAVALLTTVTGFTVPELLSGGKSLVANRSGTFVPTDKIAGPSDSPDGSGSSDSSGSGLSSGSGPDIDIAGELTCPETQVGETSRCDQIPVHSVGTSTLKITSLERDGDNPDDFNIVKSCRGKLKPDTSCSIEISFTPKEAGDRSAVLVVHQNLPGPASEVKLTGFATGDGGTGPAPCRDGFVWREATTDDHVCVTPEERSAARDQNDAQTGRLKDDGTCVDGFVWREATPDDHACVTPDERDAARAQNERHTDNVAG